MLWRFHSYYFKKSLRKSYIYSTIKDHCKHTAMVRLAYHDKANSEKVRSAAMDDL